MEQIKYKTLTGNFAICSLSLNEELPAWIFDSVFYNISKTNTEICIVCETKVIPFGIKKNDNWNIISIQALQNVSMKDVTAKFSAALAAAKIDFYVIATYDKDHFMIKEENLKKAIRTLKKTGFQIENL